MTSKPLWQPDTDLISHSHMQHFLKTINQRYALHINSYDELHDWSITNTALFWQICAEFCGIQFSQKPTAIMLPTKEMQKTRWFLDATFNFAQNLLWRRDDHIALIYSNENEKEKQITYADLYRKSQQLAHHLQSLGIGAGDRVAGFVTNTIETVIAMLASTSIGAIWTACSPEFGFDAVYERFSQIEPVILFTVSSYQFQGKKHDLSDIIKALQDSIPSIKNTVNIETLNYLEGDTHTEIFTELPFDHPLYILYSSGTTGKPKCMAHGAGNTLVQHKKELMLHTDLHQDDVIFFYTTCSWMMWHWLISSLSVGATIVLYDGSPFYPKKSALFDLIDRHNISIFGCGAKLFETYLKENISPKNTHRLKNLKTILSTGSPLIKESFDYIYQQVKTNVRVSSISGGSDIISCFALGNPLLPVYPEELQCRGLGMAVEIFDDTGQPIQNTPGELVCTKPFPSMPLYFWNDPTGEKYFHAYFDQFPNVWTHGDYAQLTEHNGLIIHGRSDATLNPGGIRIGTADIYEQVLKIPAILDCVAIGQQKNGDEKIILFVKLDNNGQITDTLINEIKKIIRQNLSPFHVPKLIFQVSDIPKTINGKTMELVVKNIMNDRPVKNIEALLNPSCLEEFKQIVRRL